MIDVHAVLLGLAGHVWLASGASAMWERLGRRMAEAHLVAGIHVHPAPEAVVDTAIFHVVTLSGHGQSGLVSGERKSGDCGLQCGL